MFFSRLPQRLLFHFNLCTRGTWLEQGKIEMDCPPQMAVGISAQMCQLKIGLEAQFIVHSWGTNMNTQQKSCQDKSGQNEF